MVTQKLALTLCSVPTEAEKAKKAEFFPEKSRFILSGHWKYQAEIAERVKTQREILDSGQRKARMM